MKWWYVGVLVIGMGIGWWILGRSGAKKVTSVVVNSPVEKTTFDVSGKSVQTVEVSGTVQKWHPDTGEIEFLRVNKLFTLTIDPAVTVIFVPSKKDKNKEIRVSAKGNIQWQTAFCAGDFIAFGMLRPPSS